MLERVGESRCEYISLANGQYPSPFKIGLEYAPPVRGTWNIVHTGMLIPGAHQIFACAQGCLRGVVLTAAEMNATDRFSTIAIRENNVLDGDMETLLIDGVSDIIEKLNPKPPAILLYTSCIHHFIGCDLPLVYRKLREKYPRIDFTDCYMNPIMRKSGLTPDQLMRRQLYSLLEKMPTDGRCVNIIGNDLATDRDSEMCKLITDNGFELTEIMDCKNYGEYKNMAKAFLNISYNPAAKAGGEKLKQRLGSQHIYLPVSYDYDEIEKNMAVLAQALGVQLPDFLSYRNKCDTALENAHRVVGNAPVAIDYTVTFRPFSLARLLVNHGFNVTEMFADSISCEDKEDFEYLKEKNPEIKLYPASHTDMRFEKRHRSEKTLAIGQKAAYFTGSDYFVNVVECGGYYGFDGICKLSELVVDAFLNKKDAKKLVQIKGMGCGCV